MADNLTQEDLTKLRSYFDANGQQRQVSSGPGGEAGPTYNTVANTTNVGGQTFSQLNPEGSGGSFIYPLGGNKYRSYDKTTGAWLGDFEQKDDFMDKLGAYMPYIVAAGLTAGIGSAGFTLAGAPGAGGTTGLTELGVAGTPVGSGEAAATGLAEPGAVETAGGVFNPAVDSQAANVGIEQAGGNAIEGYTTGSAAPAIPTGTGLPTGAGPLSNIGEKIVGGLTPANVLKYGPAVLTAIKTATTPTGSPATGGSTLSPEQQAANARSLPAWDWDAIATAAKAANMPISSYMARNWPAITGGQFVKPDPVKLAQGGVLNYLAQGGGSGRDDTIDAKLSDGEYVMDAETVSLLGDGSTKAGAEKLDQMRKALRRHKGQQLAHGNISADAKSPLAYLKESQ